jgi:hypothetical protein
VRLFSQPREAAEVRLSGSGDSDDAVREFESALGVLEGDSSRIRFTVDNSPSHKPFSLLSDLERGFRRLPEHPI